MKLIDATLRCLVDPTRRSIIVRLTQGAATVSDLVDCFQVTQPTISSHLKVLERAGLISRSRNGQTRPCKLEPAGLRALEDWLGQLRSTYRDNYARLDHVLADLAADEKQSDP